MPSATEKPTKASKKAKKTGGMAPSTQQYTINLHKRLHNIGFKKRAPRAIREVKKFARDAMKTTDVRIDPTLNKYLWCQGIRSPPVRVRVELSRKRSDSGEEGQEEWYTVVSHVPTESLAGLKTKVIHA